MIEVTALPVEPPALAAPPKLALAVVHALGHVFLGGILRNGLNRDVTHGTPRERNLGGEVKRARDLHELLVRIVALHKDRAGNPRTQLPIPCEERPQLPDGEVLHVRVLQDFRVDGVVPQETQPLRERPKHVVAEELHDRELPRASRTASAARRFAAKCRGSRNPAFRSGPSSSSETTNRLAILTAPTRAT